MVSREQAILSFNDKKDSVFYVKGRKLIDMEDKVIFGEHLGKYKYYNMYAVIASAFNMYERKLAK